MTDFNQIDDYNNTNTGGCSQRNGQRIYRGSEGFKGGPPGRGCEVKWALSQGSRICLSIDNLSGGWDFGRGTCDQNHVRVVDLHQEFNRQSWWIDCHLNSQIHVYPKNTLTYHSPVMKVYVTRIPRDCFEKELLPVFTKVGPIYEHRLMMEQNGLNRGYAYVQFTNIQVRQTNFENETS